MNQGRDCCSHRIDCYQSKGVAEILSVMAAKHCHAVLKSTHYLYSEEQKLGSGVELEAIGFSMMALSAGIIQRQEAEVVHNCNPNTQEGKTLGCLSQSLLCLEAA